jgi:hypothetical protein
MASLLLRALVALLCLVAAAAQLPPLGCADVEEKCSGSFSLPCCPKAFLQCDSRLGRCLYVAQKKAQQG